MNLYKTYFLETITKRYAEFDGRARRSEYWYFLLFNMLTQLGILALGAVLGFIHEYLSILAFGIFLLYAFGVIIPSIALIVRRLHDIGKSGWMYFLGLIPLAGPIILLVFFCTDSQPGTNQYGPNPKEVGSPNISDHLI